MVISYFLVFCCWGKSNSGLTLMIKKFNPISLINSFTWKDYGTSRLIVKTCWHSLDSFSFLVLDKLFCLQFLFSLPAFPWNVLFHSNRVSTNTIRIISLDVTVQSYSRERSVWSTKGRNSLSVALIASFCHLVPADWNILSSFSIKLFVRRKCQFNLQKHLLLTLALYASELFQMGVNWGVLFSQRRRLIALSCPVSCVIRLQKHFDNISEFLKLFRLPAFGFGMIFVCC